MMLNDFDYSIVGNSVILWSGADKAIREEVLLPEDENQQTELFRKLDHAKKYPELAHVGWFIQYFKDYHEFPRSGFKTT